MTVSSPGGRTASRPRLPSYGAPSPWFERIVLALVATGLTSGLVLLATRGLAFAAVACLAAAFPLAVLVVGRERLAIAALLGAFFLAPMYLGISPSDSTTVTPPDLAMLVGGVLLLPTLLGRRLQLPLLLTVGLGIMAVCAAIASAFSASAVASLFGFVTWMISIAGLAILLAVWRPPAPLIAAFAWSYVAGQAVSTAGGTLSGHVAGGRWYGLSNHPNEFAAAGMMSVALLLFLFHYHRSTSSRVIVCFAGALAVATVVASGGRAATVVVAVLIVMYPLVERSAVSAFGLALLGGTAIALLPGFIGIAGEDSALARLTDASSTLGADIARSNDRAAATERFLDHFLDRERHDELRDLLHPRHLPAGGGRPRRVRTAGVLAGAVRLREAVALERSLPSAQLSRLGVRRLRVDQSRHARPDVVGPGVARHSRGPRPRSCSGGHAGPGDQIPGNHIRTRRKRQLKSGQGRAGRPPDGRR